VVLPADPFQLGVASGDPLPDSVILWTRLIGVDLPPSVPVTYRLATDEGFTDVVARQELAATADDAHAIHAEATGLAADSWYFYRFEAGGFTSPTGRTRTLPSTDGRPDRLVFGSASCQNFEDGFYSAHADIVAAELDVLFWLGDYIYEGAGRPVGGEVVRSHDDPEPVTLADYRLRYARYKADPLLQASHASCPWVVTWDDHEVDNNYAALISQDDAPSAEFGARRADAYRAWWEHQPVRLPKPGGVDADYPIYRGVQFGTLVDVSVLDTRQYRSDQACGDVTLSLDPACAETAVPDRTLLGAVQEQWLFDRLGRTGATWNVLAQQVIMARSTVGDAVLNFDQWDGYPAARDRLLGHVAETGVENLVVLTGDIHFAGVARLRAPNGTVVGVEFVDTSISSSGDVPAELESLVGSIGDVVAAELAHRGWTKHVVTADEWVAEFRIVDNVLTPDSPSAVWKSFRVAAGVVDVAEA
jgi:alkaline phosphatase D